MCARPREPPLPTGQKAGGKRPRPDGAFVRRRRRFLPALPRSNRHLLRRSLPLARPAAPSVLSWRSRLQLPPLRRSVVEPNMATPARSLRWGWAEPFRGRPKAERVSVLNRKGDGRTLCPVLMPQTVPASSTRQEPTAQRSETCRLPPLGTPAMGPPEGGGASSGTTKASEGVGGAVLIPAPRHRIALCGDGPVLRELSGAVSWERAVSAQPAQRAELCVR